MNPVLILAHNCLEQTKRCVESVLNQTVDVTTVVIDNGSTDGTAEYLNDMLGKIGSVGLSGNAGVSKGWNDGLRMFFDDYDHVLVMNNDTVLPPWFYSELLSYDVPFVTGVSVGSMAEIATQGPRKELVESPDFSGFLIRREAWEKIGEFDESMVHYASDLDFHIRAWRKGIHLWNAGVHFYHERSSTLNQASTKDRRMIQLQADADRDRLEEKWGCRAWDSSYAAMFSPETFGIENEASQEPHQ